MKQRPVMMRTANDGRKELSVERAIALLKRQKGWNTRDALCAISMSENANRIQLDNGAALWLLS